MSHIVEIKVYDNEYDEKSQIPCNSAKIIPLLEEKYNKYKWAWICHDKDVNKDTGEIKKCHWHFVINATNTTISLDKIRRDYKVSYSNVYTKDDWNETVKYLAHRTTKAIKSGKHQYDISDIHCNFDITDIFIQNGDGELNEPYILDEIVKAYFDKNLTFRELGKYADELGAWKFFRKNIYLIRTCIEDEKNKRKKAKYYKEVYYNSVPNHDIVEF